MSQAVEAEGPAAAPQALSRGRRRFLRYWSLNVVLARRKGQAGFPGFSYSDDEWARMDELSNGITTGGIYLWLGAVTLTYMLVAAVVGGGVIGTAMMTLWRNAKDVPEPQFFAAAAIIIMAMVGLAMPLSIAVGGLVGDLFWPNRPAETPADGPLYAKVVGQFRRMGLFVGVLVVVIAAVWGLVLSRF
ncbi:MAG TPA: hypothetical protein VGG29_11500 [Caulobacteraceae bacterium]